MVQLTILNYKTFSSILRKLSDVASEAKFVIKDNLKVIFYDKSNVSYSCLDWDAVVITEPEETEVGISLIDLLKFTKNFNDDVIMIIKDQLTIIHQSRKITLPLLDDVTPMKAKEINLPINFVADNVRVQDIIENAANVTDSLSVQVINGKVRIISAENAKSFSDTIIIENESKEQYESRFSPEFLTKLLLPQTVSSEVKLSIGNDMPIVIRYEGEKWKYVALLAPRIDNN